LARVVASPRQASEAKPKAALGSIVQADGDRGRGELQLVAGWACVWSAPLTCPRQARVQAHGHGSLAFQGRDAPPARSGRCGEQRRVKAWPFGLAGGQVTRAVDGTSARLVARRTRPSCGLAVSTVYARVCAALGMARTRLSGGEVGTVSKGSGR